MTQMLGQTYEGQYESKASNFFLIKWNCNNNAIYKDDSHIFCNYEAIFPQRSRHFQHAFANAE
jgi:bisphosphoglycerate-independent phosphoglycerate mutase (AlkP superfamily)